MRGWVALADRLLDDEAPMLPVAPDDQDRGHDVTSSTDAQPVEGARVADERHQLGEDLDQPGPVVADVEVPGDVALDLRLAPAERDEHGEGEQLAGLHVEAGAGEVVTEAVGRQVLLDVLLVGRSVGVQGVDGVRADDLLLHRESLLRPSLRRGGRLAGQGQLDATRDEHVVRGVQEVEHLGHAHVRHGLVDDLLDLDRGDAAVSGTEHDPESCLHLHVRRRAVGRERVGGVDRGSGQRDGSLDGSERTALVAKTGGRRFRRLGQHLFVDARRRRPRRLRLARAGRRPEPRCSELPRRKLWPL